jgi:hypothetical protein
MRAVDKVEMFKQLDYVPHPKQVLYHQSKARFRIACCGRRFGKSTMSAMDLAPELFIPSRRFWIVGPTYDLGEKEFRVLWDALVIKKGLGKDKRLKKAYNKRSGEMFLEFPWHTRLEVRSADHPEYLVGESLHGVIMSEAAKQKRDTFERYIRAALADYRGWATFPTTPEGFNWLYSLWQLGQDPTFEDYESWRFPSWENTHVYPEGRTDPEIVLIERTTSPEWFLQEIGADFASFVGKIYSEFDETVHVTNVQYRPGLKSYMTVDWGFVNPLAAIWFQVDAEDNIYVWREHYQSYKRLAEHIEMWKAQDIADGGRRADLIFGDAEDPEAVAQMNYDYGPTIALPEAKKNWREGIECVKRFLKLYQVGEKDEYGTPLERPKLFIDHSCRHLIYEFNNYRAPETRSDEPANEQPGRKRPVTAKQDDHALDALRYGLMHIYTCGVTRHLSDVAEVNGLPEFYGNSNESGYFTTTGGRF